MATPYPKPQAEQDLPLQFPSQSVSFDPEAFDTLIRTHAVSLQHWRSIGCPGGLSEADEIHRSFDCSLNCSNGYLYICSGTIMGAFTGNNKEFRHLDLGLLDGSSATIILPRYYEKENPGAPDKAVQITTFDRIYLTDATVTTTTWEKFNCSLTNVDRLRFPIVQVVDIIDSLGQKYVCGLDFNVTDGRISWVTGKQPGPDPVTAKGRVVSIRYTYRPYYYVSRLLHEIRVNEIDNEYSGVRETIRFPQNVLVQREFVYLNEKNDPQNKPDKRFGQAPNDQGYRNDAPVGDLGTK